MPLQFLSQLRRGHVARGVVPPTNISIDPTPRTREGPGTDPYRATQPRRQPRRPAPKPGAITAGDNYLTRLTKYVPGEITAAFILGTSLAPQYVIWVAAVCLVLTPVYSWIPGRNLPVDVRPRLHFFILATASFAAWALAVNSTLASQLHIAKQLVALLVFVATFSIPAIDAILEDILQRRAVSHT